MSSTIGEIIHYSEEEIARLKYEEAQRYERIQQRGTSPDQPRYQVEPQHNRKARRKQAALSRSTDGSDNG